MKSIPSHTLLNWAQLCIAFFNGVVSLDLAWCIFKSKAYWTCFNLIFATFIKVILWDESPSILIQGNIQTADLKYPAVTLCPKVSTKYGIVERLGNYIDPMNLPKELISLRHGYFICATGLSKKNIPFQMTPKESYKYLCVNYRSLHCKVQTILRYLFCIAIMHKNLAVSLFRWISYFSIFTKISLGMHFYK